MRNFMPILAFAFFVSCGSSPDKVEETKQKVEDQTKVEAVEENVEDKKLDTLDPVAQIRIWFGQTTENMPQYRKKSVMINEYGTEGGELVAYFDKQDQMARMVASIYGETGNMVEDYYVHDGKLYFVFVQNHLYNTHVLDPDFDESKTTTQENRYYYNAEGRLIQWLDENKKQVSKDKFSEKEKYYQDSFFNFIQELNRN